VPQDETERILEERVARLGVRVERNTELIAATQRDAAVSARLRTAGHTEDVEVDWLLGCDGAHSAVRDQLAIPFLGNTYPERFVLADVKLAGDLDHAEGQVWLHREGALAFFPLPEDRWRLIIIDSPPPAWWAIPFSRFAVSPTSIGWKSSFMLPGRGAVGETKPYGVA
jgi:2-polyprenyl-6-methoxyphenol hydroxylase-like FAD-dependent oxidoreductase